MTIGIIGRKRGMTRVWVSWEVSAGACNDDWLRQFIGREEQRVAYQVYARTRDAG